MRPFDRSIASTTALSLVILLSACNKQENSAPQHSSTQQAPPAGQSNAAPPANQVAPPTEGGASLNWTVPAGWEQQQPTSAMRKAQYRVPGAAGDAELVVFYFGPGQGGDAMSNAQRWASQFALPDGSPATSKLVTSTKEVNGMQTLLCEVEGTYTNQMVSADKFPDHALLGAVVQGPDANWFFKLTGPKATIAQQRAAFDGFIGSVKK